MIKICLERWKEVVRFTESLGDYIDGTINIVHTSEFYNGYGYYIFNNAKHAELFCAKIKEQVEQYNNSIKDDGYIVYCDKCSWNCKRKDTFCKVKCSCQVAFWQKINNNKIEIIEE